MSNPIDALMYLCRVIEKLKMHDPNDIIQDKSNLEVATIELHTRLAYENPEWWVKMAHCVNGRFPDVLSQKEFTKNSFKIYFTTNALYLEFVKMFPEVLRGEEE